MAQFGIALLGMRTVEDSAMDDLGVFPYGLFGTENMMGNQGCVLTPKTTERA